MAPRHTYLGGHSEAKRIGHIIGIAGGLEFRRRTFLSTIVERTESNYHPITAAYIAEKLHAYLAKDVANSAQWRIMSDMFDTSLTEVRALDQNYPETSYDIFAAQVRRHQAGQPVHICTGWEGHHIGVTLYKGYIIVSNRGERGDQRNGTKIFKLKAEPTYGSLAMLQKVFAGLNNTPEETEQTLARLTGEEVASFPQTGQRKGTCSYVNKLASTEALMALLTLDAEGKLDDANIARYARNPENRAKYKDFTSFARHSEVERVLALIEDAEPSSEQHNVMVNIAYKVATKYLDRNMMRRYDVRRQEVKDAYRLINAVEPFQRALCNGYERSFPVNKTDIYRLYSEVFDHRHEDISASAAAAGADIVTGGAAADAAAAVTTTEPMEEVDTPSIETIKREILEALEASCTIGSTASASAAASVLNAINIPSWLLSISQRIDAASSTSELHDVIRTFETAYPADEKMTQFARVARELIATAEAGVNVDTYLPHTRARG